MKLLHVVCAECFKEMVEVHLFSSSVWECATETCVKNPNYKPPVYTPPAPYKPKSGWQSMQELALERQQENQALSQCKHGTSPFVLCTACGYGDDVNDPIVTSDT